jgi:propionyl-CoA synthetase
LSLGEHLDHETRKWSEKAFGVPVVDHWWQTESGWPISAQCIGYTNANMSPPKDCSGRPVPGWNIQVLKDTNDTVIQTQMFILGIIFRQVQTH